MSKGLTQQISLEPWNINHPHFLITAEPHMYVHKLQLRNFFLKYQNVKPSVIISVVIKKVVRRATRLSVQNFMAIHPTVERLTDGTPSVEPLLLAQLKNMQNSSY